LVLPLASCIEIPTSLVPFVWRKNTNLQACFPCNKNLTIQIWETALFEIQQIANT
jgi:hypothetical protein